MPNILGCEDEIYINPFYATALLLNYPSLIMLKNSTPPVDRLQN